MRLITHILLATFGTWLVAGQAGAQVSYTRGEQIWTNTFATVGLGACTACHGGSAPSLATLRQRFSGLTQTQARTRFDLAITTFAAMAGYAALVGNDRDSLAIYLGDFIPSATVAATTSLTALSVANVGQTAESTLTITNIGATPLTISAMTLSGPNSTEFSRVNVGAGCVAAVPAGMSCQELVRFTPTATGTRTATLTVSHDRNPLGAPLALSGTATSGVPPAGGGGAPASSGGGGGGATLPWALLLLGAAVVARRRR